jgi:DUF438 domain-containing protein
MSKMTQKTDNVIRFKEVLLALHRGARPKSLFDQFHDIIVNATPDESEEIKKQMLIEGVPKGRAKRWSRTHLAKRAI